jgi:hypothetical protein
VYLRNRNFVGVAFVTAALMPDAAFAGAPPLQNAPDGRSDASPNFPSVTPIDFLRARKFAP